MSERKFDTKLVPEKFYVDFSKLLAAISHVSKKTADSHLLENEKNWGEYFSKQNTEYIEKQYELEMLQYGSYRKILSNIFMKNQKFCAARNSCEVISVYNALADLKLVDENTSFPKLLNYFEKKESILKGYFGTSFFGLIKFFKKFDFPVEYLIGKHITEENLNRIQNEYETFIFMSFNNKDNIADMIHTMSITKEEKGYFIHNSYAKPIFFESLYEAVIKYNEVFGWVSKPIIVMGIRKPDDLNKKILL